MFENDEEQRLRTYLKDTLVNNDSLVIPKVISEVVNLIGIEKTAELSGLSLENVNKSISLAKVQKELEPFPNPYKIPPSLNMDLKGLCEYAQKSGKEISELSYVEFLDFIK